MKLILIISMLLPAIFSHGQNQREYLQKTAHLYDLVKSVGVAYDNKNYVLHNVSMMRMHDDGSWRILECRILAANCFNSGRVDTLAVYDNFDKAKVLWLTCQGCKDTITTF